MLAVKGICGGWWRGVRVAFAVLSVQVGLMPILARIAAGAALWPWLCCRLRRVFPVPMVGDGGVGGGWRPALCSSSSFCPPPGGGESRARAELIHYLSLCFFCSLTVLLMFWVTVCHPFGDCVSPLWRLCVTPLAKGVSVCHPFGDLGGKSRRVAMGLADLPRSPR